MYINIVVKLQYRLAPKNLQIPFSISFSSPISFSCLPAFFPYTFKHFLMHCPGLEKASFRRLGMFLATVPQKSHTSLSCYASSKLKTKINGWLLTSGFSIQTNCFPLRQRWQKLFFDCRLFPNAPCSSVLKMYSFKFYYQVPFSSRLKI